MQTPRSPLLVLGLASLVLAVGWGDSVGSSRSDGAATDPAALSGTWVPQSFGPAGGLKAAQEAVKATVTLDAGAARGSGGVNRFTTTYEAGDDGTISFAMVASTRMAGEDGAMAQESELFGALQNAERFEITDGRLVLSGADKAILVVFARK